MKQLTYLFILLLIGCGKDEDTLPLITNELLGIWQLEATKISPGDIVENWTAVTNGPMFEFKANGSYTHNEKACGGIVNGIYSTSDSLLTMRYHCKNDAIETNFNMSFSEGKLILSNVGCIEECSYKYRKME
ncbi:hypothetical protein [Arenibacter sp. F20364]|uniref:hypothetical protein n=1 Tax=Arenibacter sp. F20364 TaxID=2926415 RepID=UPI001FF150F1|nr:hypothetical protein [Arenibacter sp. F20364]MCK0190412.1 hypothetical protein [Arenibacter sp. F20364]